MVAGTLALTVGGGAYAQSPAASGAPGGDIATTSKHPRRAPR